MKTYQMFIYFRDTQVYELEVEADNIETAREITWDNFIDVAYADGKEINEEQISNGTKYN